MTEFLSPVILDRFHDIGDGPIVTIEADRSGVFDAVQQLGLLRFARDAAFRDAIVQTAALVRKEVEARLEPEKLRTAQRLCATYGTEIAGALLLAALPETYAARGSVVLLATGMLDHDVDVRVRGTAEFLLIALQLALDEKATKALWIPDPDDLTDGRLPPWAICCALRLYHQSVREKLEADGTAAQLHSEIHGAPLNQEDLIGTLLTFSITVFEVLERFGIRWTREEQEAYLHTWDVVGNYLGVGHAGLLVSDMFPWPGVRPSSITETIALLDLIRVRQWPSVHPTPTTVDVAQAANKIDEVRPWSSTRAGRILARNLLELLTREMPAGAKSWPLAVMRQLSPPVVRDRLHLGASGFSMSCLGLLPKRKVTIDRFTDITIPNPMEACALRTMSNEVVRRTILQFLRTGRFEIPGLEDWTDGFVQDD